MKAQKLRGREEILSARIVFLFALVLILLAATSQALAGWDIYHDTDIHSGTYGLIDIYDSPPDNTTVNFYGDLADYIGTHDSSTLNFFSGEAEIGAFKTMSCKFLSCNKTSIKPKPIVCLTKILAKLFNSS